MFILVIVEGDGSWLGFFLVSFKYVFMVGFEKKYERN